MAARLAWRPQVVSRTLCGQQLPAPLIATRAIATKPVPLAELLDLVSRGPDDDSRGAPSQQSKPPVHIVRSAGRDPYTNLAVEHRLFERAHPASVLLVLYRNAPCVVIGRNQNPWAEVHLSKLVGDIQLVRRRSGGGTVYHDAGNANWSVHLPHGDAAGSSSPAFDRDRHVLMVARALQRLGVPTARVNERHDIVVGDEAETYKVSGSAYKLTRRRALHHGTCLLGADLAAVSGLLRAPPAAPYVKARGVASVRSPVRNVEVAGEDGKDAEERFDDAVADEFEKMYGAATSRSLVVDVEDAAAFASFDPKLAAGCAELRSADWRFGQTPQFSFSTSPTEDDPRARPPRPLDVPPNFHVAFTARHGRLQDVVFSGLPYAEGDDGRSPTTNTTDYDHAVAAALDGQLLYHIRDWRAALAAASPAPLDAAGMAAIAAWLDELFGVRSF